MALTKETITTSNLFFSNKFPGPHDFSRIRANGHLMGPQAQVLGRVLARACEYRKRCVRLRIPGCIASNQMLEEYDHRHQSHFPALALIPKVEGKEKRGTGVASGPAFTPTRLAVDSRSGLWTQRRDTGASRLEPRPCRRKRSLGSRGARAAFGRLGRGSYGGGVSGGSGGKVQARRLLRMRHRPQQLVARYDAMDSPHVCLLLRCFSACWSMGG